MSNLNRLKVKLQDVMPSIVTTSKVSVSLALILVVVTEMFFTAKSGLGYSAHQAYLVFRIDLMYLEVLVVGAWGVVLNKSFDFLLRIILGHKNGQ